MCKLRRSGVCSPLPKKLGGGDLEAIRLLLRPFLGQYGASQRPDSRVSHVWMSTLSANCAWFWLSNHLLISKPHLLQMRLARLIVCLEERKVVARKSSFTLFGAISQVSTCHLCAWGPCVGVHQAIMLIGNTKETTSEGKTWSKLTRPAVTALIQQLPWRCMRKMIVVCMQANSH